MLSQDATDGSPWDSSDPSTISTSLTKEFQSQCILNGPPGGSGVRSGRLESWTTSCISSTFDLTNASFGSVPDCACPLVNASERTQLRKSWRLFQTVKTTYGSPSLTGRSTWLEMKPGILSTRPARSRNLCSKASAYSGLT